MHTRFARRPERPISTGLLYYGEGKIISGQGGCLLVGLRLSHHRARPFSCSPHPFIPLRPSPAWEPVPPTAFEF